jgi:hypothetical protein
MTISIEYKPDSGIVYEKTFIPWGTTRKTVRDTIQGVYETNDQEFAGTVSRRDIYNQLKGQPVLLFLNYDSHNQFSELEIHNGIELNIFDKTVGFEMQFWDAVEILDKISSIQKIIDEGEVLFIDLKLSICSGARMSGDQEDNQLSYIYCTQDISHLLE